MEVNDAPNVRPDITFLLNRNKESFRVCRVIRDEIRPVCHTKTPVSDMTKKEGRLSAHCRKRPSCEKRRLPTLPHCIAVPSAMTGLTSLFGMGRGGTPSLSPP